MVLASEGVEQIDAKLVALSQLPAKFDIKVTTDLLMWGYALVFGYDATEFWPVSAGVMGRGKETDIQHRKATGKGGLNFVLSFQEQLQAELPDTVHFVFEQRDAEGEILDAELKKTYVELVTELYESGLKEGSPLLSREEARSLLADFGVIDPSWTVIGEPAMADDLGKVQTDTGMVQERDDREWRMLREEMLNKERVIRAIEKYPDEPIVRYTWNPIDERAVVQTLWKTGKEAYSHYYQLNRVALPEISVRVSNSMPIQRPSKRAEEDAPVTRSTSTIKEKIVPKVVEIEEDLTVNGRNTPILEK